MKKIILFVLSVCLIFSICGCSSKDTSNTPDLETQYYNFAQESIESGDIEKAISALEEGIEKTGSEKLKELLDSLNAKEAEGASSETNTSSTAENASPVETSSAETPNSNSNSTHTESPPSFIPLSQTNWIQYDSFTGKMYYLHFIDENTLEYGFTDLSNLSTYEYQYNGDKLVIKYYLEMDETTYTDTYFVKIISLEDSSAFSTRTDKIQLEGQSFLAGFWEFNGAY